MQDVEYEMWRVVTLLCSYTFKTCIIMCGMFHWEEEKEEEDENRKKGKEKKRRKLFCLFQLKGGEGNTVRSPVLYCSRSAWCSYWIKLRTVDVCACVRVYVCVHGLVWGRTAIQYGDAKYSTLDARRSYVSCLVSCIMYYMSANRFAISIAFWLE